MCPTREMVGAKIDRARLPLTPNLLGRSLLLLRHLLYVPLHRGSATRRTSWQWGGWTTFPAPQAFPPRRSSSQLGVQVHREALCQAKIESTNNSKTEKGQFLSISHCLLVTTATLYTRNAVHEAYVYVFVVVVVVVVVVVDVVVGGGGVAIVINVVKHTCVRGTLCRAAWACLRYCAASTLTGSPPAAASASLQPSRSSAAHQMHRANAFPCIPTFNRQKQISPCSSYVRYIFAITWSIKILKLLKVLRVLPQNSGSVPSTQCTACFDLRCTNEHRRFCAG